MVLTSSFPRSTPFPLFVPGCLLMWIAISAKPTQQASASGMGRYSREFGMASKQDDHNRGQKDGAKSDGLDELLVMNNPLETPEYKQGFQEGRRNQLESKAKEKVELIGTSNRQS